MHYILVINVGTDVVFSQTLGNFIQFKKHILSKAFIRRFLARAEKVQTFYCLIDSLSAGVAQFEAANVVSYLRYGS